MTVVDENSAPQNGMSSTFQDSPSSKFAGDAKDGSSFRNVEIDGERYYLVPLSIYLFEPIKLIACAF